MNDVKHGYGIYRWADGEYITESGNRIRKMAKDINRWADGR
jgi:hypothetical protein